MLALSLALFVSCNGKDGNNKSETTETISETSVEQESTETEMPEEEEDEFMMPIEQAPTYYNLVGKVAGSDVHMSLELDHNKVMGRYYYDSQSKKATPASMKFFGVSHGAHMEFTEFYSDKPTGTFDGYWSDESFQGTFTRAKDGKTFDFSLTSVYAAIEPGGGEAFFQDFDDFYFDIPFYNKYNPSQDQTVMQQPQLTEEEAVQYVLDNAINFADMLEDYNNPFKAEKKYIFGTDIILRVKAEEIKAAQGDYSYVLMSEYASGDILIYTNDGQFVELDYPQLVWVSATYNARYKNDDYGDRCTYEFTNAQMLLGKKAGYWDY